MASEQARAVFIASFAAENSVEIFASSLTAPLVCAIDGDHCGLTHAQREGWIWIDDIYPDGESLRQTDPINGRSYRWQRIRQDYVLLGYAPAHTLHHPVENVTWVSNQLDFGLLSRPDLVQYCFLEVGDDSP
jgi:hypothetical protein